MNSFDFDYYDSLPTERVGLARMTVSPVAGSKDKPTMVFVHGSMQGAWVYTHWLRVAHENGRRHEVVHIRRGVVRHILSCTINLEHQMDRRVIHLGKPYVHYIECRCRP